MEKITVKATINAPVEKTWEFYNNPKHIIHWNIGSPDWHTPKAENDLRVGGKFLSRMEAKDGSAGFDFEGVYDEVTINETISYTMSDGRKVNIVFDGKNDQTEITVTFDPETENTPELQREGWQGILDNFKKYVEEN